MRKTNTSEVLSKIGAAWERATAPLLVLFSLICVFGIYPDKNLFWAHCRIAEWALLFFVSVIFIKNFWIKQFLIVCLFSMFFVFFKTPEHLAQRAGASAFIYFYYIFIFAIFFQILDDKLKKQDVRFIINGLCVIALLQTIYIWFQHFKIDPIFQGWIGAKSYSHMDVKDLVVGTWAHTNLSGAYLACSIPLFLRKRWFIFIPVILAALFWGRSWGAIVSCGAGIVFWAMSTQKRKLLIAIVIIIACLSYGLLFEHRQINPLKSDRMQYLKPTIEMIKANPVFGYGLGQFKSAFHAVNRIVFKSGIPVTHAHFDFIENLCETGIVGSVCIIGFLISIFLIFLKNITALSASAMAGAFALLINSCSTFIFHTPMAWIFLLYIVLVKKEAESCY